MTLPRGSSGPAVLQLQRSLMALGYPLREYGADGWLGDETLTALAQCLELAERPDEVTDADLAAVLERMRGGADAMPTNAVLRAARLIADPALGNATHHYWLGTGDYRGERKPPWTRNAGGEGSDCWGLVAYAHRQPREREGYNAGGSVVDWIQCDSCIEDADGPRVAWRPADHPEPGDIIVWPSIIRAGRRVRIGHVALVESASRLPGAWTGAEWALLDIIHVCGPNGRKPAAVRAIGAMWGGRDRTQWGTDARWRSRALRIVG